MERKRSLDLWPEAGLDDHGDSPEKKRLLLCADFTAIASCEAAVARHYLTENAWEMERALNAYFEPRAEDGAVPHRPETALEPGSCVDLTSEEPADPTCSGSRAPDSLRQEDGSAFSLITWNIDGLDLNNLQERAKGVCSFLALYSPDVVFLQEVIPPYYSFLKRRASNYTIIPAVVFRGKFAPHLQSVNGPKELCKASVSGNGLCLMTSHLESTRDHAQERMNQLKMVLKKMQEAPESATVIFAGDTNLRDREVTQCGGLPGNILDAWEFLGKPKHCQYTWDTQANSNLGIRAASKHRFDRIFLRAATDGGHIVPQSLDLLGLEKLDCGRFPSDHWGLLCNLDVIL